MFNTFFPLFLCILWTTSFNFSKARNTVWRRANKKNWSECYIWSTLKKLVLFLGGWWQNNGKSMRQWSGPVKTKTMLCLKTAFLGQVFPKSWFWSEHFYLEISTSSPENVSALLSLRYFKFTHYNTYLMLFLSSVSLLGSALLLMFSSVLLPDCGNHHLKQALPQGGKANWKSWALFFIRWWFGR